MYFEPAGTLRVDQHACQLIKRIIMDITLSQLLHSQ